MVITIPLVFLAEVLPLIKNHDRFIEHLERADELGVLGDVINFLGTLTKEEDFDYSDRPLRDWEFVW